MQNTDEKCWYHYNHLGFLIRLLIRDPIWKLSSSCEDESNNMEFTLVLDLVLYGWLDWGVTFSVVFLVNVIGKLVSRAGLDGIAFPCDLWRLIDCHWFTICIGPLPLSGFMIYIFGSLCFNSTTNSSLLYLSCILLQPSRWSWSNTKLPSGISRAFPIAKENDLSTLCFILFNAYWFTARMSLCCWLTYAHLLCKKLSL